MSKFLIEAIGLIRSDMERANLRLIGQMPPLVTIQFTTVEDEARYHQYVLHSTTKEAAMSFARDNRTMLRPDCLCSISGIEVRVSSDQRVDDMVRRLFK
jgi:hypothetical protein